MSDESATRLEESPPIGNGCMLCDLYAVIDAHTDRGETTPPMVRDLVSVLPPRGHGLHNLAIWQDHYRTPWSVPYLTCNR